MALRADVAQGSTAKADFLANISHELRTPVTVAKGIAYVLKNPAVPEEERNEFLGQLTGSLDKLMGIVDELITLSELERGTFELSSWRPISRPSCVTPWTRSGMRYPGIPIAAEVPDGFVCMADGPRLGSVVRELLDNACRYSPFGRAVELVARDLAEGVIVMVTDRGEGLDRAVAARAFEQPFSTGEGVPPQGEVRRRAGLHLARQLVVEHGGVMWVDPLPGGGTRAPSASPGSSVSGSSRRPPAPPDLLGPPAVWLPRWTYGGGVSCPRGSGAGAQESPRDRGRHRGVRMHPRVLAAPTGPGALITPSPTAVQPRHRRPGAGRGPGPVGGRARRPRAGIRGGFVASPRHGPWADIDGSAVGMSAMWVDATRVGVPSDFYYLAANGPCCRA